MQEQNTNLQFSKSNYKRKKEIDCICKHSSFISPIIKCIKCNKSYHTICLGYLSQNDIRCKKIICLICKSITIIPYKLIQIRKLVYYIFQSELSTKKEIIKECGISITSFSKVLYLLKSKNMINELFDISKKSRSLIYKPKNTIESKKILLKIYNGSLDISNIKYFKL